MQRFADASLGIVAREGLAALTMARLAEELGIERVVVPRVASAFCAFGAVVADLRHDTTRALVGEHIGTMVDAKG